MSGLETFLIACLAAFVSCVGLLMALCSKFVMKAECGLKHDPLSNMAAQQDLIFRMLRAVIIHLDIPPDEKERILNMPILESSGFIKNLKRQAVS